MNEYLRQWLAASEAAAGRDASPKAGRDIERKGTRDWIQIEDTGRFDKDILPASCAPRASVAPPVRVLQFRDLDLDIAAVVEPQESFGAAGKGRNE